MAFSFSSPSCMCGPGGGDSSRRPSAAPPALLPWLVSPSSIDMSFKLSPSAPLVAIMAAVKFESSPPNQIFFDFFWQVPPKIEGSPPTRSRSDLIQHAATRPVLWAKARANMAICDIVWRSEHMMHTCCLSGTRQRSARGFQEVPVGDDSS